MKHKAAVIDVDILSNYNIFYFYCDKTSLSAKIGGIGDHLLSGYMSFIKTSSLRMQDYAESQEGMLPNARGHELANIAL